MLELPGAWEPPGNSDTPPLGASKDAQPVFLMETKLRRSKMEAIKSRLGFEGLFVVDCHGRSGGLALMWNREAHVSI